MPRSSAVTIENNFTRGLITEATAMNYPENSVVEADNCVFDKSGRVIRRYGVDYEDNYSVSTLDDLGVMSNAVDPEDYYDSLTITEYEWTTVGNDGSLSFAVVQIGDTLRFYEIDEDNTISPNLKTFSIDLTDFQVGTFSGDEGQFVAAEECSFASGRGYLIVTHPLCNPFYVEYDADADGITATAITITVRDFERIDDSIAIDNRPASLTDAHKYNLYNQGWYISAKNSSNVSNVVTYWDSARTDFPSNADVWWLYKNASDQIDSTLFDTVALGNTPAPNGHYTYNAFNIDRDTAISASGLPSLETDFRPSTTAFYAGRVWYSGVDAPGYISNIYFSKIIESNRDLGTCHQVNDPTSESNADLLGSDGGVISIPEASRIVRLVPVSSSLYVFATNGLWKISGPNGIFTANDYSITKISSASITAKNSIVIAEGLPFWWDRAGIYNIQFDPNSNQETVINVSETTIQTLINSVPESNLPYVKGAYNNINKTIHWIYNSVDSQSIYERYSYNKLLVLNLTSRSFSPETVTSEENGPTVCGLLFTSLSNNDNLINEQGASIVKFLTKGPIGALSAQGITFSQYNDDTYLDWFTFDGVGVSFTSYFITGYRVRGELLKKFQSNYVVVVLETEPNASCLLQGVWDYSNDPSLGKFTTTQQVYFNDSSRDYSRRKFRIRGNGYSLQFKFSSEAGKPFTLVGWATFDTGNNVP